MTRVLVTGASGFVGTAVCDLLARYGYRVRAALRTERRVPSYVAESVVVGDIGARTDWKQALADVDAVIHLAARVHVLDDPRSSDDRYTDVNARGTQNLARECVAAGVRRLVYVSSVKVNGELTGVRGFSAQDEPAPMDAYGRSKWLAERHLTEIAAHSRLQMVIVRPPLVYGPGVRANFLRLMRWIDRELPLPFGSIRNQRSLVSLWNLSDLLVHAMKHAAAPGRVWMAADAEDLSTPELITRIGRAMGRRVRLLQVPVSALHLVGLLSGRAAEIGRLCGSLTVDASQTCQSLSWAPPVSTDEGIDRTVRWYLSGVRFRGNDLSGN